MLLFLRIYTSVRLGCKKMPEVLTEQRNIIVIFYLQNRTNRPGGFKKSDNRKEDTLCPPKPEERAAPKV